LIVYDLARFASATGSLEKSTNKVEVPEAYAETVIEQIVANLPGKVCSCSFLLHWCLEISAIYLD
jgi:hypothetical protein